ncbi:MAG: ABC transporter ATP-binding protein [Spirochaetaceae bacterium]|nr:ABC transporter ATP-binding protein [Spirochaetaceae bacterium]
MTGTPALLEVDDLHVVFPSREGAVRAVNGVSFALHRNEVLGIIGESGCGKSVTALSILGILPPVARVTGGSIRYHGAGGTVTITDEARESETMKAIRRNDISMIFQEPMTSFSPVHTIGNQITEAIAMMDEAQGIPRQRRRRELSERALDVLGRVGLNDPDILAAYPHNLSGGMRQRAMIAMAVACEPRILIADEPTTALDVTLQAQALNLMLEMQRSMQMAVILVTHDLGVIAEITERVVVMYLGRVVETAPVGPLFARPEHPYSRALLASIPRLSGPIEALAPIRGMVPSPYEMPPGGPFHTRCDEFVPGRCDRDTPATVAVAADHRVACLIRGG